eukprot:g2425.t1
MKVPLASAESDFDLAYRDYPRFRSVATYVAMCFGHPLYWLASGLGLSGLLLYHSNGSRLSLLAYLTYIWFDREKMQGDDRKLSSLYTYVRDNVMTPWNKQSLIWRLCCAYYPMHVHKTAEIDPAKRLLFVTHPHGVFGVSTQGNLGTFGSGLNKLFPEQEVAPTANDTTGAAPAPAPPPKNKSIAARLRLVALEPLLLIPFLREYLLVCGAFSPNKKSFQNMFARGDIPVLNVGGAAESLVYQETEEAAGPEETRKTVVKVILKNRKGFVKLALQHGASLVPCVAFEENLAYSIWRPAKGSSFVDRMQTWLQKKMKFGMPLFYGNWLPFHPTRQKQNMYVGGALDCTRPPAATSEKIAQEEIDAKHAEYIGALRKLFDDYKEHAGHPNWVLQITDEKGQV